MAWKFNPFTGRLDYTVDIPAGLPPTGAAGGDLAGTYPNPTVLDASIDHGSIGGLTDDDHPQYPLLAGRAGGQTLRGGTTGTDQLILRGGGSGGVLVFGSALAVGLAAGDAMTGTIHADQSGGGGSGVINCETHSNVAGDSSIFLFRRSRGTHALPSAVQAADTLGTFTCQCWGTTNWFSSFSIESYASETWTDTKQGTILKFFTTRLGTTGVFSFMESRNDGGAYFPGPVVIFGTTGVATTAQVGLGVAGGTESTAMRIQSGNTAGALAALYLNCGGTDRAFWATDGTNTSFAYTGSMIFASGLGGPTRLAIDASGNMTLAAKIVSYNGIATAAAGWGVPAIHDFQTGVLAVDIGATSYANAGVAGMYRVSVYLRVATADVTAGVVTVNTLWNDGTAARTVATTAVLTATNFAQATIYVRLGSGSVQFSITHTGIYGAAAFGVSLMCERLQ